MIFVGDIALPYPNAIVLNLPGILQNKQWFANFEGAAIDGTQESSNQWIVYNDKKAVESLSEIYKFSGFGLANNHIFDCGTFDETIEFLNEINIPYCGAGKNLEDSAKGLLINEGTNKIYILNFGWEVIQCEISSENKYGVNPLVREHVIKSFNEAKQKHPDIPILIFFHWNYELEAYPHPFERELSKHLIDAGAAGVIGCHPHRVGGFEMYNGRPIVYSLGNWMFMQGFYHHRKIKFPEFCNLELAFEWNFETDEFFFHFFEYNKKKSEVDFIKTEDATSQIMKDLTPFRGMNDEEYKKWYKFNRFHKKKGLPVYYFEDPTATIKLKDYLNWLRDKLIFIVVKLGLK